MDSDGGNSFIRRTLNVPFEGRTKPNQWIVVDVKNDPNGTPHIYMHCDPERPYVSAALPHGIRRFEFMVMPGETEEELSEPENMAKLMRKVVADPDKVDYIRKRVYTHNARLAGRFRVGRILLAGDAAHIMPVWQGQGYNSGMRDAGNLAWKLAAALRERRRGDARTDQRKLGFGPATGQIRQFRLGAAAWPDEREERLPARPAGCTASTCPRTRRSGACSSQAQVTIEEGKTVLLDEVIGLNLAVIAWGTDPTYSLTPEARAFWDRLGTRFITTKPAPQMAHREEPRTGVINVGDATGRLKDWFADRSQSNVFVRPDCFVAALSSPQEVSNATAAFAEALAAPLGA